MNESQVKAAVRERDGYRCTRCGMTQERHLVRLGQILHVHRIVPGSEYTVEGCVTVCIVCHGPLPKSDHNTDAHSGHLLPARAREALWSILKEEAKRERRSIAQTVILLLEEALRARGKAVPPEDS
jgi:hypothetical protein